MIYVSYYIYMLYSARRSYDDTISYYSCIQYTVYSGSALPRNRTSIPHIPPILHSQRRAHPQYTQTLSRLSSSQLELAIIITHYYYPSARVSCSKLYIYIPTLQPAYPPAQPSQWQWQWQRQCIFHSTAAMAIVQVQVQPGKARRLG